MKTFCCNVLCLVASLLALIGCVFGYFVSETSGLMRQTEVAHQTKHARPSDIHKARHLWLKLQKQSGVAFRSDQTENTEMFAGDQEM